MRTCLVFLGLLGASLKSTEDAEIIYKESLGLISEMTNVLRTVDGKVSAEGASPKLGPINRRFADLNKKALNVPNRAESENRRLFTKHKLAIEAGIEALASEVVRIENLPEAKAVLARELKKFEEMSESMLLMKEARASVATVQIRRIGMALQVYKLKVSMFPDSLEMLTESKNPFLRTKDLYDPWGQRYLYDPSGARNDGRMPDVWTMTPEKETIGNWTDK